MSVLKHELEKDFEQFRACFSADMFYQTGCLKKEAKALVYWINKLEETRPYLPSYSELQENILRSVLCLVMMAETIRQKWDIPESFDDVSVKYLSGQMTLIVDEVFGNSYKGRKCHAQIKEIDLNAILDECEKIK